jgi:hypothetical protein
LPVLKLDAATIGGVFAGLNITEGGAAAAYAKNFAFGLSLTGRLRRFPKGDAKVNHYLRRLLPLIDSTQIFPQSPRSSKSVVKDPSVLCELLKYCCHESRMPKE